MGDTIQIYNAETGETELRVLTAEEQAAFDVARAKVQAIAVDAEATKQRLDNARAALEAVGADAIVSADLATLAEHVANLARLLGVPD